MSGFILNRPTRAKLENCFPGTRLRARSIEPVSLGGPMLPGMIVALTRKAPLNAGAAIPLMSGLVAVIDSESVDRVIETTPNNARYFVGLVIWAPGELDQEIRDGAWNVRPASVEIVFSANPAGLWKELGVGSAGSRFDSSADPIGTNGRGLAWSQDVLIILKGRWMRDAPR